MGKIPKIKKHQQKSIIQEALLSKKSVKLLSDDDCFKISLRHIDKEQGQSFHDWQNMVILANAIDTLSNYCHKPLSTQHSKSFKIYGGFPPKDKTDFQHPNHIPEDAEWASIHVTGKQCLIGHVVQNTFYLVFLDAHHRFWISELKHT